ncbi:MAG: class I SAM-dependent methyltransferase [Lysobacter sp.]|nr:class I SAM-dependent methyltransferase [Lysobacter sp.]
MTATDSYWNSYYGHADGMSAIAPSQFAAFLMGELAPGSMVVDLGCGTGRDTLFFAQQGLNVVGVDASQVAIDFCERRRDELGLSERARFVCEGIQSPGLARTVRDSGNAPKVVYARFFLHAIDDEAEGAFIDLADEVVCDRSLLAIEFRTHRDSQLRKETPGHYRRYIEPSGLISRLAARGFQVRYFVEGFGYAKYKSDDAHVARILCSRGAA